MKKKIIAAALAAVVAFNICTVRPRAAAAAGIALAVGSAAVFLMGVFTGQYDDTANGIGAVLENGVEGFEKAFVGTEKTFCGKVIESEDAWIVTGYKQICRTIQSWVNSGEATIDSDGNLHIDYKQYLALYGQLIDVCKQPEVAFKADYDYAFYNYVPGSTLYFASLPLSEYAHTNAGQAYAPVYFNDDKIIFGRAYAWVHVPSSVYEISTRYLRGYTAYSVYGSSASSNVYDSYEHFLGTFQATANLSLSSAAFRMYSPPSQSWQERFQQLDTCFVYENGGITVVNNSDISNEELADMNTGLVSTYGDYAAFIKSIRGYYPSYTVPDLSDLSDTLPLDKTNNPSLVVSSDPSIAKATDAVTVTDVPGVDDTTLTNYMTEVKTDIDVPSIIVEKFPFCIPYDFIRIIGVLCADPEPPVFRIPLSTNPDNLKGFEGNQTIGNIPEDFEPMFELDEEIVIDLSVVPLVQPICYTIFIVGFVVLLIVLTPKLIQH